MEPSPKALTLIKTFEGLKLKAYLCPAGVPTLGYGSTGPDIRLGMTWTLEEANKRLLRDVVRFAAGVSTALAGAVTTQAQFDGLVSFAYNVGLANLKSSTLLRKHRAGDAKGAALEFLKWNKARNPRTGKLEPLAGLTRRREAEKALYQS